MNHEQAPGSLLDRDDSMQLPNIENVEHEPTVAELLKQLKEARQTIETLEAEVKERDAHIADIFAASVKDTEESDERRYKADTEITALLKAAAEMEAHADQLELAAMEESVKTDDGMRVVEEQRREITRLREGSRELRIQANTDKLSGLGNRHAFEGTIDRLNFEGEGGEAKVCTYFDLGNLTGANNTGGEAGHAFGDRVIKHTAASLSAAAKECNEYLPEGQKISLGRGLFDLTRQGGDEFAAFLPNVSISYPRTNSEGEHVLVEEPVANVFLEQANNTFGTVPFCGNIKGEEGAVASSELILGVCSLAGGAAEGGKPGAIDRADIACKKDKQANRERVVAEFLRNHEQPAPDGLGRIVQVVLSPDRRSGTVIIDGVEMPFDKIIVDKWSKEYTPAEQ